MKLQYKEESDLHQRLVSRIGEELDAPAGATAGSVVCNADVTHPLDSFQSIFQVQSTDVYRQTWEAAPVLLEVSVQR